MWGDPGYKETTLGNIKLHLRKYGPHEIHGSGFVDFFGKLCKNIFKKKVLVKALTSKIRNKNTI